jgi:ribonuclease P protein component
MLAKQYRLQKDRDFESVFKKGKTLSDKFLFLKVKKNDLQVSRFGLIIGKKISNKAVIRNRLKRQLREIIKNNLFNIKPGFDIVVITKSEIINKNYQEIKNDLEKLLKIL